MAREGEGEEKGITTTYTHAHTHTHTCCSRHAYKVGNELTLKSLSRPTLQVL